jgi:hypothetical protein
MTEAARPRAVGLNHIALEAGRATDDLEHLGRGPLLLERVLFAGEPRDLCFQTGYRGAGAAHSLWRDAALLPHERPGSAARLLRLPRRALGSSAHVKPNRERIRDGASSNRADERSPVGEDSQAYGRKNMATIEGRKSVAESRPRHQIPKRH